jgi:chemotaxis protein MotB
MLTSFASFEKRRIVTILTSFMAAVNILPGGVKTDPGKEILELSADIVERGKKTSNMFEDLKSYIRSVGLEEDVKFSLTERGLVVTLVDAVLFDLGTAEISPKAFPLLNKIGSIISKSSYLVRIEGHTDNLPIHTERFPSNWELSATRAVNVLRYFIEKEKIPPERLSAVGYGEFQPLLPNDSPQHRARNRRMEIIFVGAK